MVVLAPSPCAFRTDSFIVFYRFILFYFYCVSFFVGRFIFILTVSLFFFYGFAFFYAEQKHAEELSSRLRHREGELADAAVLVTETREEMAALRARAEESEKVKVVTKNAGHSRFCVIIQNPCYLAIILQRRWGSQGGPTYVPKIFC